MFNLFSKTLKNAAMRYIDIQKRNKSFRINNSKQKVFRTLASVGILVLVLQLAAPLLVEAVLPPPSWPGTWITPPQCSTDPAGEASVSPTQVDLIGDSSNPAIGFAVDGNYRYFRERLNGDPSGPDGFGQSAWVVLFQTSKPKYQFLGSLNGKKDKVQLYQNTTVGDDVDFDPLFNDPAEESPIWEGDASIYARIVGPIGGAYYVDWAIPLSVFPSGVTDQTTKFFATSSDANNYNKDHLNCYEAIADVSIVKTDNPDPVDVNSTLTYTLTVTNNGPDPATNVVVADTLPAGFTLISVTPSIGSCSDIIPPSIQCELGTMNNDAVATITIVGNATAAGTLTNSANVSSTTLDTTSGNNSDTEDTTVNALPAGTVLINKVTVGGDGTFSYTGTGSGIDPSFDIATTGGSGSETFENITPGARTVIESEPPAGWDFTSLECSDPDQGTTIDGQTANIDLDDGETVTCTYTNTQRGTIIVEKVTSPASSESFGFTSDISGHASFSLSNGDSETMQNVVPDSYTISETPNGDYNTTVSCTNGAQGISSVDVNLNAGLTVICTFTNILKQGGITITKVTQPSDSQEQFGFTSNLPETGDVIDADGNFTLGNGDSVNVDTQIGTYNVNEDVPAGWDLSIQCSGSAQFSVDGNGVSISLGEGVDASCVFTNTQRGHLMVQKTTNPAGDSTVFPITAISTTGGTIIGGGEGSITDSTDKDYEVTPGTYSVNEHIVNQQDIAELPDWFMSGNDCLNKVVGAGETVTCTITNTEKAKIIVVKQAVGDNGTFSFTGNNGIPNFDITTSGGTGSTNIPGLVPGTFAVSETVPAGWDLTSATCDDGSDPSAINLSAGETVTCTFTNEFIPPPPTPEADVSIVKDVDDSTADIGQQVTFTMTVTNGGPDPASAVIVTDVLPAGLDFVSATSTLGTYSSSTNEWVVGDMAVGQDEILTIEATVSAEEGAELTNTAVASSKTIDPNSDNNSDDAVVTVNATVTPPPLPPPPPSGGGSSGGGSVAASRPSSPTSIPIEPPAPQVLGEQIVAPPAQPEVAGVTLPRTGSNLGLWLEILIGLVLIVSLRLLPRPQKVRVGFRRYSL